MAQDIVANADVFKRDLANTGHAAVYGTYFSSLAPVAPNDSDEGRAKNRRVELVKQ